jgi:hypothetical protein
VHKCFTKKWEEEAAKVQSSQATQASSSTSAGTSTSKPENKPVGSANTMTIDDDLDGNGFWAVEDVDTYAHIDYFEPNPEISNMKLDADDEASHTELAGMEDKHALDWFGSDDQLVTKGEDSDAKEEANAATLEEKDAPRFEALPVPHHVLHVPIISHTLAFLGEPDKKGHAF